MMRIEVLLKQVEMVLSQPYNMLLGIYKDFEDTINKVKFPVKAGAQCVFQPQHRHHSFHDIA